LRKNGRLSKDLFALILATLVADLGFGIVIPSLPGYVTGILGAKTHLLGMIISIFALFNALFKVPMGALSDRYGRKPMIVGGLVVSALAPVLMTVIRVPLLFLPIRALDGMGNAAIFPAANALITDTTEANERATAMSAVSTASFVGSGAGPVIGGLIYAATNSYLAPFYVSAGLILSGALIALFTLSEPAARSDQPPLRLLLPRDDLLRQMREATAALRRRPMLQTLLRINFLLLFGLGLLLPTFILYIQNFLGFSPQIIGVVFTVSTFVSLFALLGGGRLADRIGRRIPIVAGLAMLALSFVSVLIIRTPLQLIAVASVSGIGGAILLPALLARLSELCPDNSRGAVLGFIGTVQGFGLVLGPTVGGWLWDSFDPRAPFLLCCFLIVAALILAVEGINDVPARAG